MATAPHHARRRTGLAAAVLAGLLLFSGCPAQGEEGDDEAPQQPVPGATNGEGEGEEEEGEGD